MIFERRKKIYIYIEISESPFYYWFDPTLTDPSDVFVQLPS